MYTKLRLPTSPLDPQASAAFLLTKPRLDQSGNEIPDESEGQQQVEIQRSFEEPDFSLLSSAQPHEIGCEVPIIWDPSVSNISDTGSGRGTGDSSGSASTPASSSSSSSSNPGVLVFLGVFSAAQSGDKSPQEMRRRRDLYRTTYFPHFPPNLVTAKFILGLPPQAGMRNPAAAIARAKVMRMIEEERDMYGDMVILDVSLRGVSSSRQRLGMACVLYRIEFHAHVHLYASFLLCSILDMLRWRIISIRARRIGISSGLRKSTQARGRCEVDRDSSCEFEGRGRSGLLDHALMPTFFCT